MDLDTIIYIVITIALVIISAMGKKKETPLPMTTSGEPFSDTETADFSVNPVQQRPLFSEKVTITKPHDKNKKTQDKTEKHTNPSEMAHHGKKISKAETTAPKKHFDLRKAIIYSEIIKPKYF